MRISWTVVDEARAMTLVIDSGPVPLAGDAEGVACVGGTRVTLDTLVAAFEQGATAEEIAQQYPWLGLADVYAVSATTCAHARRVSCDVSICPLEPGRGPLAQVVDPRAAVAP